ncbi:ISH9-type transposase [Natronococcus jeotgali DSM 18795]|uniref:ISH9-type transposase n=1 Tax=Natronococcus jeotgali DSM 18795 TaxID=1227498 RepID=L9XJB8_9EURY|nr:ISH9-type transposase [Natronococcus jeotgali DSM 18795]
MEIDLLDFVEQWRDLVKQALGKRAGKPASGRFARWGHVVLDCLWLEDDHSYRETPSQLKYMAEIRDVLALNHDEIEDTVLHHCASRLSSAVRNSA